MDTLLTTIGLKLFEIVLPALATALAGLLVAFLTKKLQSIGITVSQQQQQQLKDLAAHTVLAVEESSRRAALAANNGLTPSSVAKDAAAVAIVSSRLPKADLDDVRLAIDAALPSTRSSRATALVPSTPGTLGRPMADVARDLLAR